MPLYMRLDSSGYRFVRPIPVELQPYFDKKNFVWRLGKDPKKAKLACAEYTLSTERALASARQKASGEKGLEAFLRQDSKTRIRRLTFTEELPGQVASLWLSAIGADAAARANGISEDEYEARETSSSEVLPMVNKALATGNVEQFAPMVSQLLMLRGYSFDATPDHWQRLCYDFLRLIKPGLEVLKARQNGDQLGHFDTSSLPPPLAAVWEAPVESASPVATRLSGITPVYEKHLSSLKEKDRTTRLSIWNTFVKYADDKPLSAIRSSDIYDFLEHRLNAPATEKPWSQGYVSGRVINVIRSAFSIAKTKNLTASDPAQDLTELPMISAKAEMLRRKPRYPYTAKQLNKLFSSAWYDPGSKRWHGRMRDDLGARYWIPLLCMWHGFRVREACQVHLEDVDLRALTLIIRSDDTETSMGPERSVKNETTVREVPIHPELIRLGFPDFVNRAETLYRLGPLFPSALPAPGSRSPKWGRAYEQAYLRHVRDKLGFGHGYGSHSFRHSLEDRIRAAKALSNWPNGLSSAYTGRVNVHAKESREEGSEKGYGRGYETEAIRPFISQISYPDVVLPQPFPTWIEDRPIASGTLLSLALEWERKIRGHASKNRA